MQSSFTVLRSPGPDALRRYKSFIEERQEREVADDLGHDGRDERALILHLPACSNKYAQLPQPTPFRHI